MGPYVNMRRMYQLLLRLKWLEEEPRLQLLWSWPATSFKCPPGTTDLRKSLSTHETLRREPSRAQSRGSAGQESSLAH